MQGLRGVFVGIKIAEKRSLPCPHRLEWYTARDNLYEEIMEKSWNAEKGVFRAVLRGQGTCFWLLVVGGTDLADGTFADDDKT